jgi:hypothetical protein
MANPNIVGVTHIYGNTSTLLISSTADPFATALVSNAASSNKVYKINSIVVANVDGTAAADVTIKIFSAAALGGTGTAIASTISIPPDASLIVTDKTTTFYLLEDRSIGATASAANDLVVTCSWEEIDSIP